MGFLRKALNAVKNWFTGGNGSSNGSASRSASIRNANRITNYGGRSSTTAGSNYGSSSKAFREQLARQKEEEEKKRQKIWSAFKSTESKAGQSTSSSQAPKSNAFKASPPDPKLKAAEESRKRLENAFKAKKAEIADYHKATNNKYNPDVDPLARQRVKMGEYQSDPKVAKFEVERHPIASSAARGALSGVTFGASELLAKYGTKGESKRAEEYYQKHKNKTAETVGEIAGSLASFGMTGGASSALGKKVGGEALEKAGTRVAAKLAENPFVKRAAQRELRLAVKKGAVEIGSKEAEKQLLKELAENRAKRIVSAVGEDMAINLTTGAASDINHAILDSDNPEEFAKNMGINAAMNLGIGGVTSVAPALRVRGGLPFVGGLQRDTKELLARRVEKEATDALTPLTRTAKETASNEARKAVDTATEVRAPEATPEVRMPEVRQPKPVPEVRSQIAEPQETPTTTIGNGKRTYTFEVFDGNGKRELITVKANKASEASNLAGEYGLSKGMGWSQNVTGGAKAQPPATVADDVAEAVRPRTVAEAAPAPARVEPPQPEVRMPEPEIRAPEPSVAETARREPTPQPADDFPYEGTPEAEDMIRRINDGKRKGAETYRNEREAVVGRVKELENEIPLSDTDRPLRVNKVAEDTPLGGTTEGIRKAESAYERNTGEKVEGGVLTSWHEAWKASQEYHASHATGRDRRLSKTSVTQLHAMKSDEERALRDKGIEEGWLGYDVIHTEDLLDKVSKEFRDDPNRWVSEMIEVNSGRSLDFRETPEWQARAHYIMAVVNPSSDPASEIAYTEAYKLATRMSSIAGQTNNLRRQFVHLTPAGRRDAIIDEMAQILYNSQGFNKLHKDMPKDKYDALAYIKALLEDDPEIEKRVQKLVEAGSLARDAEYGLDNAVENATKNADNVNAESIASATDNIKVEDMASVADEMPVDSPSKSALTSDEIMEAHAELLLALNEKNPKAAYDVVQEIRYLNMLGNPKTHLRNVFGSGFFGPIRQVSNLIRSGLERTSYVKNSNLDITLHGGLSLTALTDTWKKNPTSEAGKKALAAFERVKPELLGSMKLDNQLYSGRAKTLAGKALDKVSDFNSHLLSKEDDFFKEKAFRENYIKMYERYNKSGTPITKKIEKKIEAEAMQEAQIATFNEYNEFAKYLSSLSRKANDPNASALSKGIGMATNAAMPFTRVPANIMKQSINYSPLGIVKGFSRIQNAVKRGDSEAMNKAIDELASGVTGSVIFGFGMLLGKTTDSFTTNAGKNDAAAKFKKQQGVQNYSVTFTNPADGEKYSLTLDWLVPNSATFFAGVEAANQMKKGKFNLFDLAGDWGQVMTRLVEPVLETSMLSGLYNILESTRNSYGEDDKQSAGSIMLRELAQSYVNSLTPTLLGQAARTLYKNDKQIAGETDPEYFKNQMKSKLGLAETNILGDELGADTDAYGNVKGNKGKSFAQAVKEHDADALGKYGKSALKNFLSPANIQKVDLSSIDKQKIKQYEDAVKAGEDPQDMAYLFPKKQYKKQFKTGDMEVKLSNKDLSAYNQAKATGGDEGMRYILENIMFNRPTTDANGKKVPSKDAYTAEQKAKLIAEFDGKSIRDVEKWMYEQPQFKDASEAERRKAINGLWSYSNQGKAQASKRAGEQAVVEAQGGDVNQYNFNNEITEKKRKVLQPLIDSGVVSYEEAVDFARYAGKTYYYENEEGGTSQTYFNKGQMMEYLESKGYDEDKAAALFNAFKAWNAKEYGKSSGYRRYGRRRYGGYRRRGRGGSGKAKKIDTNLTQGSAFKSGNSKVKTYSAPKVSPPKASSKSATRGTTSTSTSTSRRVAQPKVSTPKVRTKVSAPSVSYKSMASASSKARKSSVSLAKMKYTPPKPKKGGK